MKHPSSREFFAYWDAKRGDARAPDRSEIEPGAVRGLLGDIFVLSYDNEAGYPFRVAGTRLSALLGRDLKDLSFSALFAPRAAARSRTSSPMSPRKCWRPSPASPRYRKTAATAHLELLLLPFNNRAHAPVSMTGLLAPFEGDLGTLGDFKLTSWRYLHRPRETRSPRVAQTRDRARLHGLRRAALTRLFVPAWFVNAIRLATTTSPRLQNPASPAARRCRSRPRAPRTPHRHSTTAHRRR